MVEPKTAPISSNATEMICPGETHSISRSVHYARMAAFYPACRNCSLRYETGHLSKQILEQIEETSQRIERENYFSEEGIRGVYLNEINRSYARNSAAAFASLIWNARPRKSQTESASLSRFKFPAPQIVVGRDSRPSSPDIYSGVISGLKQTGCEIIDISITTSPCFRFSINHLEATAGLFVTGEGSPPSWTGIDFLVNNNQSHLSEFRLEKLKERMSHPVNRPTREAGHHRHFQANVPYEASLWKHFHALRPLKIMIGCSNSLIHSTLKTLFDTLPCQMKLVELPLRERNLNDPEDMDIELISHHVHTENYDLGMIIDDDGMKTCFVDDLGHLIDQDIITCLIADLLSAESPGTPIVLDDDSFHSMKSFISKLKTPPVNGGHLQSEITRAMSENESIFGRGTKGQFWFKETSPTCDSILTLARMLEVLSRDDIPFSQLSIQVKDSLSS